jgi:hypothetical protein
MKQSSSHLKVGGHAALVALKILFVFLFAFLGVFSVAPVHAVTITGAVLTAGTVGNSYFATIPASSVGGSLSWTYSGTLPPGLTLSPGASSATISGTPTTAGTFNFSVTVTDTVPPSPSSGVFQITISAPALQITTYSLSNGMEASAYSSTFTATGGTTPYTWTISGGNLPSGLQIYSTGYISGTPVKGTAGTYSVTLMVSDSSSPRQSATTTLTLFIQKGSYQPTITIDPGLAQGSATVKSNGVVVASLKGGESTTLTLDLGVTRTVTVDATVVNPTNSGIRYKAVTESQLVSESNTNVLFNYITEYKIDVATSPSGISSLSGSGWYKKDDTVNLNAKTEITGANDTNYKFSYWLLPDNRQVSSEAVNFVISQPGIITAFYEPYYKLTVKSAYGQVNGGGFYKAGSEATWSVVSETVPVPGILGFFQGKYEAKNPSGTETMDAPKTVTVYWETNYVLPYILIPLTIALVLLAIFGIYYAVKRQQPRRVPAMPYAAAPPPPYMPPYPPPMQAPPAPRPIPQQHTTVVMIGDQTPQAEKKQLPPSTKEQLMEKFAQLLDNYESEIKTNIGGPKGNAPQLKQAAGKMLNAPEPQQMSQSENILEAEVIKEDVSPRCGATTRKLQRTVTGKWRQVDSSTVELGGESEDPAKKVGISITWARDVFHEWEIINCSLPVNHPGKHRGDTSVAYSLLNTITIKQNYSHDQTIAPPSPHFTDSMPEIDADAVEVVSEEELPG